MTPDAIRLATRLTYSGTLPLVAAALSPWLPLHAVEATRFALTYGAIILSFLAGIHWAVYVFFAERCPRNLLLTSNGVALIGWASLGVHPFPDALALQAISFLYLLVLDVKLHRAGLLPLWFFHIRRNATAIVVACLAVVAGSPLLLASNF